MVLHFLLRILFVVFTTTFALQALSAAYKGEPDYREAYLYTLVAAVFAAGIAFAEWRFFRLRAARGLVAILFGLAGGVAVSAMLVLLTVLFLRPASESFEDAFWRIQPYIPLLLVSCCYLAITTVLRTKDDFRFLIPYIDFSQRGTQEGGFLLDSSALIDGRVVELGEAQWVPVPVVIPDFVIRELQTLADQEDLEKRSRGRRGLDMAARLQRCAAVRCVVRETGLPHGKAVDPALIRLAGELHSRVVTTDTNLAKAARLEGVTALLVQDAVAASRAPALPGDRLTLALAHPGQEKDQGVGYLEDGTMVVVEGGRDRVGQRVCVRVTRQIQTSAGRMVFAHPEAEPRKS